MNSIRSRLAVLSCMCIAALSVHAAFGQTTPARVILDMDPARPGFQNHVKIRPNQTHVNLAVYIVGGTNTQTIYGIGFIGGIDRGIALGHAPGLPALGTIASMTGQAVQPVMLGGAGFVDAGGIQKMFVGPEVQYIENGPVPWPLPSNPAQPAFSATVTIANPTAGDRFAFHVGDAVRIWRGMGGAFSAAGSLSLDTGGDVVPDGTLTVAGIDADMATPVPPGAFLVDYIDGPAPSGPAVIEVLPCIADYNGNGTVTAADIFAFLADWFAGAIRADSDGDGTLAVADIFDYIGHWFAGC